MTGDRRKRKLDLVIGMSCVRKYVLLTVSLMYKTCIMLMELITSLRSNT